jgi:amidohydrolase
MDTDLLAKLTQWRRHLHTHPELSEHENATAAFVQDKLTEFGIPFVAGVGGAGIVATLSRPGSNRTVGLRADMDALPINEANDLPYASRSPGVMHACGHDGHTVCLLGTAAALAKDESWKGQVQFIFQPAEENGVGAKAMIADGLLERFPMERVFAFHNWPGIEAGTVAVHNGPVMAAGGRWQITLHGLAGHAAIPHQTRDPIVAAGHLIVALHTIVSRNVDPVDAVVLSIAQVNGGVVSNQIPGSVTLVGTLRTYDQDVRDGCDQAHGEHRCRHLRGLWHARRCRDPLDRPPDHQLARRSRAGRGRSARCRRPVRRDVRPSTTGDDFSFLRLHRPGAYVWIGNGPAGPDGELHNSRYDFNDAILPVAIAWMSKVARLALEDAPPP